MFADGRRAATPGGFPPSRRGADAERLILHPDGSSGDGRRWDGDFWVHPLPPQGPVTLVVAWPKYDIPETATELDGAAIREAAGRIVILWPEDPDFESTHSWTTSTMTAGDPDDPSP